MDTKLLQAALKKATSKKGKPVSFAYAPNGAAPVFTTRSDAKPIAATDVAKAAKAAKIELVGTTTSCGTVTYDTRGTYTFAIDADRSRGSAVKPEALQRVLRKLLAEEVPPNKVVVHGAVDEDEPKPLPPKTDTPTPPKKVAPPLPPRDDLDFVRPEDRPKPPPMDDDSLPEEDESDELWSWEDETSESESESEEPLVDENGIPYPPPPPPMPKVVAPPQAERRAPRSMKNGTRLYATSNHVGLSRRTKEGKIVTDWGVCAAMTIGWISRVVPTAKEGGDITAVVPEQDPVKLGVRHAWLKKRSKGEDTSMSKRAFARLEIPCEGEIRNPIESWERIIKRELPRLDGPTTFTIKHPTAGAHMMSLVAGPDRWLYMDPNFGVFEFPDRGELATAIFAHMNRVYKKWEDGGKGEYALYGHTKAPAPSKAAPWDLKHSGKLDRATAQSRLAVPKQWLLRYAENAGDWVVTRMLDEGFENVPVGKYTREQILSMFGEDLLIG